MFLELLYLLWHAQGSELLGIFHVVWRLCMWSHPARAWTLGKFHFIWTMGPKVQYLFPPSSRVVTFKLWVLVLAELLVISDTRRCGCDATYSESMHNGPCCDSIYVYVCVCLRACICRDIYFRCVRHCIHNVFNRHIYSRWNKNDFNSPGFQTSFESRKWNFTHRTSLICFEDTIMEAEIRL